MNTPVRSPRAEVVAVAGATGRQGSAVARHLLDSGWRVRALTRDPGSVAARTLQDRGAELRRVEFDDLPSLRDAFQGAHGVFNVQNPMTSGIDAEIRHGSNVADVAAEAGVDHVVYGAAGVGDEVTGVGSWDSKLTIAARFRENGVPLTVLRPMAFMELMTDRGYYPNASTWSVMPRLMGRSRPMGWLCVDDLGAIAARVFADPDRWIGQRLSLASDIQTLEQCRALWRETVGRPPTPWPMPTWLFERFVGSDLTTMWRWLRTHDIELSTAATQELWPEALTVRQWLTRAVRKAS